MQRKIWGLCCAFILLGASGAACASLSDCNDLYVGTIWIEQGQGLYGVILLQNEGDTSGSYWTHFTTFSADERKAALAILTAAKLNSHRVNLKTLAADQCSITATNQNVKSLYMAYRP